MAARVRRGASSGAGWNGPEDRSYQAKPENVGEVQSSRIEPAVGRVHQPPSSELEVGYNPPAYGQRYSPDASYRFYARYEEYERAMKLYNWGQSVKLYVFTVSELLPRSVRTCLSSSFADGSELEEAALRVALEAHWQSDVPDPAVVTAAVERVTTMGSEDTAVDRVDAVCYALEEYFDDSRVERIFRDERGQYKPGPAKVISKALVAGLWPLAYQTRVCQTLALQGAWKEQPDVVFAVMRQIAKEWRLVEQVDAARASQRAVSCTSASKSDLQRRRRPHYSVSASKKSSCSRGAAGMREQICDSNGGSTITANSVVTLPKGPLIVLVDDSLTKRNVDLIGVTQTSNTEEEGTPREAERHTEVEANAVNAGCCESSSVSVEQQQTGSTTRLVGEALDAKCSGVLNKEIVGGGVSKKIAAPGFEFAHQCERGIIQKCAAVGHRWPMFWTVAGGLLVVGCVAALLLQKKSGDSTDVEETSAAVVVRIFSVPEISACMTEEQVDYSMVVPETAATMWDKRDGGTLIRAWWSVWIAGATMERWSWRDLRVWSMFSQTRTRSVLGSANSAITLMEGAFKYYVEGIT